ncbi:MAG TPA: DUF5719 family protein, partial [Mycobacteriales bacterium]|nr:DUF5719 family protein [Mycobacteriales bacterium]
SPPPAPGRAAVTDVTTVCPLVTGLPAHTATTATVANLAGAISPPTHPTGRVVATQLAGAHSRSTTLRVAPLATVHSRSGALQSVAFHATGALAATVSADQVGLTDRGRHRGLFSGGCAAPATDWWFAGADGRVGYRDRLVLANPAPVAASVAVSLWSAKGVLSPPHLDAVQVAPRSVVQINLAAVAPDQPTITIHVHAASGSVTAGLIDQRTVDLQSNGGDIVPATQPPSRSAVVAGYVAGSGAHQLVIGDPGSLDATATLRLITPSGSFTPSEVTHVVVRAGHTRAVGLTKAFNGASGAVSITSDQPVVAQGVAVINPPGGKLRPDLSWLAATPSLDRPAAVANGAEPDGGTCRLLLTAPDGTARLMLTTPSGKHQTIEVPARRSVSVDVTSLVGHGPRPNAFLLTPLDSAPVYGIRLLYFAGAHGALVSAEPLRSLPGGISLPAVLEDPDAALR